MKTNKTKTLNAHSSAMKRRVIKSPFRKYRLQALIALFMLILGNRVQAQSCSLTLTQTPSSAICAGGQVTLSASTSGINLGTGADGSQTINSTVYTDNTRSAVNGSNAAGINKIRVVSTSGYSVGNEVLIISMVDANTSGNLVGRYEFKTISSVSGDTLLFTQTLGNSYVASSTLKHQVIKVPQYTNLTVANGGILTCNTWNGATGGVLCFRASGSVIINAGGQISADGKGYRGVSHAAMYRNYNGAQGEGIYGQGFTGAASNGSNGTWNNANGNGGGGGTGLQDAAGGGGGSYGSAGAAAVNYGGHNAGLGGNTVGNSSLTLLYLGGAGGEAGADEDGAAPGNGGNGGGIILISANSFSVNGSGLVTSSGATGGTGTNAGGGSGCGMGGGGGGAGGSIYLASNSVSGSGSAFLVNGGAAGANNGCGGNGATGGSGRIRIDSQGSIPATSPAAYAGSVPSLTGLTYVWSNGSTASSIVVSPSVTTNYSVTITSTTGCTGTSASALVTVNPLPSLNINGNVPVCAGGSLTLTATGANTYTWSNGSNATSLILSPATNASYTLTGKSSAGCVGTAAISNVTVSPIPTLSINSGSICNGSSFTLTPTGASSYTIQGGNAIVSPNASTSYTVRGADSFGCVGNVVTSNITVNPLPVLSLSGTSTLCAGNSTTLTANGAGTYAWSNGATTGAIVLSPSITTSYSVNGTSAAGCQASATTTVQVYALPLVSISGTNAVCAGNSLTLTAGGANTYSWSNGATTSFIVVTPTANTNYSATGTSIDGCVANSSVSQVTVNALPVITISGINAICSGNSSTLTASGANSYLWTNSSTASSIVVSPLSNTSYAVEGTDLLGCIGDSPVTTVTVNPLPSVSISGTNAVCAGGSVTLTANGASTYLWSDNSNNTNLVVTPSANTSYTVTGFSAFGCQSDVVSSVAVYALPLVSISGTNAVCAGNSVTLTASGADTYAWSNGANTAVIVVTPAANTSYSATGTSTDGCVANSSVSQVTVNALPVITISGINAICSGNTSTLTASGANSYLWTNSSTASSIVVSPLSNTSYSVEGTDLLGCIGDSPVTTVTVNPLPLVSISGTNAVCAGGSVTLTANGANSYLWNNNSTNGSLVVTPSANTSYTVTGFSAFGCQSDVVSSITVNALPVVSISGTNAVCSGNSATLTASGANSYLWNTGATSGILVVSPGSSTSYSVAGTSIAGCIGNSSLKTVSVNALPLVSISGTNAICAGKSATLIANGANTYSWSNGATSTSIVVSPVINTSYSVNGTNANGCLGNSLPNSIVVNPLPLVVISGTNALCAGASVSLTAGGASTYSWSTGSLNASVVLSPAVNSSYTVTGTSAVGCQTTAVSAITVNALPLVTITGTNAVCAGNSATLIANGAATYNWSNGATSSLIVVSPSVSTNYSVSGISVAGCVGNSTLTNVSTNSLPLVTISGSSVICSGTSATLIANGAATYYWSNGASTSSIVVSPSVSTVYSVSGNSSVGCVGNSSPKTLTVNSLPLVSISGTNAVCAGNSATLVGSGATTYSWNNGSTNSTLSVSPAVTTVYTLTGINATGCQSDAVKTLTVNTLPLVTIGGINTLCDGGSATLTAGGALSYTWSNAATTLSISITPTISSSFSVVGANAAGCAGIAVSNITVNPLPVVSISGNNTVCAGNSATLSASGASNYTWSNGATTPSIVVSPSVTSSYSVNGIDMNSCSGNSLSDTVTVNALPVILVNTPSALCAGDSVSLFASGAVSYSWSTGATSASVMITPSVTGSYSVSGVNVNGCENSTISTITVNALPVLSIIGVNTLCYGDSTILNVSGANTYSWSTGAFTNSVSLTPANTGTYSVSGTDLNGCKATESETVVVNPLPVISVSGGNSVCLGDSAVITASGANTYTWNTGANTASVVLTPTATLAYLVSGSSAAGCIGNSAVGSLSVNQLPVVTVSGSSLVCSGSNATLTAGGAVSYSWSNGGTTTSVVVTPSASTVYTVTGTDSLSCKSSAILSLAVNPTPVINVIATASVICAGETVSLSVSGANNYVWNTGDTSSTVVVNPVITTQYSVSGSNSYNCSATQTLDLLVTDCTGLNSNKSNTGIRVYPNPNNGEFVIDLGQNTTANIVIVNALGETILNTNAEEINHINLSAFNNGIYFVRVLQNNQTLLSTSVIKH